MRIGRPGDRWLEDLQITRIERATRGGTHGYEVSYDVAGHGRVVIFWPRDRIDFAGRSPGSRLETMKLQSGRLRYPQWITRRTLPRVHEGILQLEEAYAKQADGAISAMEGFVMVAGLGGLQPKLRAIPKAPPRSTAPRGSNKAASPSPTGAAAKGGPKILVNAQQKANNLLRPGGRLIGRAGSSSRIRVLEGGQAEARALFKQLVRETGARPITSPRFPGTLVELPGGGGRIGLRAISQSSPPTIDVFIRGLGIREIEFLTP